MTAEEKRERTTMSDPYLDDWTREELTNYILELEAKIKDEYKDDDCDCQENLYEIDNYLFKAKRELNKAFDKLEVIDRKSIKALKEKEAFEEAVACLREAKDCIDWARFEI